MLDPDPYQIMRIRNPDQYTEVHFTPELFYVPETHITVCTLYGAVDFLTPLWFQSAHTFRVLKFLNENNDGKDIYVPETNIMYLTHCC
jgi:hypothetical protein